MTLDCNGINEYLIKTDSINKQLKKAFKMMQSNQMVRFLLTKKSGWKKKELISKET